MNTKGLRQKILDLAIHGKLVPQNPNDESAEVLLERIRAEKAEKIKSGELKADKKDSFIFVGSDKRHYEQFADGSTKDIEDEIPFAVPAGWAWCRFGNFIDVRDGTHYSPKYVENGYPFVTSKNLVNGKIDFTDVKYISEKDHREYSQRSYVEDGDILFAMIGSIGNPVLVKKDREFSIKNVALFKPYSKQLTNMKYLFFYLLWIQELLRTNAKGGMQPFIPLSFFRTEVFIPLPPLAEQERIVAKIEEIFAQIDDLEQNKGELQCAIKQAKAKILDLAIHGKLVPQEESDESAEVLLRIRAEKAEKIKRGELKADKKDSFIFVGSDKRHYERGADGCVKDIEDEIPFELPAGWAWCLLGDIITVINGRNQKDVVNPKGKYPIYGSGGIMGYADDYICPENCTIIGRKGSINNPIFVTEKFWNVDTAFGLLPSTAILPKFLFYFCEYFDFTSIDSSTTLPSLTKTNIQQIIFALPPIKEQKRIVGKIEQLFAQLDSIAMNLG